MAAEGWPYAVTRGKTSGWQAIVVPGFLKATGESYVLEYASKPQPGDPGAITVRDVLGTAATPLSIAYRVTRPQGGRYGLERDDALEDEVGRPIRVFEGLVLPMPAEQVASIGLTAADFDTVTDLTVSAFRKLWLAEKPIDAESSTAILVGEDGPALRSMPIRIAEPYVVPGNQLPVGDRPPKPGGTRRGGSILGIFGVVVIGILAALIAWLFARSSPTPSPVAPVVRQLCSELKSGDARGAYRQFSIDYRNSVSLAAFRTRLLGSSTSATCTSTSISGDQATLHLRLRDGTARTVDLDFQSRSGQWRATAIKITP